MGKEQPASYYDRVYAGSEGYKRPYQKSHYFPMWQSIVSKLDKNKPVLDIGCGTGQLASYLWDKGFRKYIGIDFSKEAIAQARKTTKETEDFRFIVTDLFAMDYKSLGPCQVVCLETLEHIAKDQELIAELQFSLPYCPISLSVPTFDDPAHVRYFRSLKDVEDRFPTIQNAFVRPFSKWIILEGTL